MKVRIFIFLKYFTFLEKMLKSFVGFLTTKLIWRCSVREILISYLLFSDAHYMVVPPNQQKGQVKTGIGRIIEFFIGIWKRKNNALFEKAISKISLYRSGIFLGDLVECIYNERGMITTIDMQVINRLKKQLKMVQVFVPGDHELGYILPLSLDPKGGMSQRSAFNFMREMGRIYDYFYIRNFHFLFLCSSLFTQDLGLLPVNDYKWLKDMKKMQERFILDMLKTIPPTDNIFVFLHDPDALYEFDKLISRNCLDDLKMTAFCGHLHSEGSLKDYEKLGRIANAQSPKEKLYQWFFERFEKGRKVLAWSQKNLLRVALFKKYNLHVVPALGGMMGKGGGYKVLNLYADSSFDVSRYKL